MNAIEIYIDEESSKSKWNNWFLNGKIMKQANDSAPMHVDTIRQLMDRPSLPLIEVDDKFKILSYDSGISFLISDHQSL